MVIFEARNLDICEGKSSYTRTLRCSIPSDVGDALTACARFGHISWSVVAPERA